MTARRPARRRGVTLIESTLVLSAFFMLLFGVFEYCRYLFVVGVTQNACRDGARYAVANVDKPTTFSTTDYTVTEQSGASRTWPSIQKYTESRLYAAKRNIRDYAFEVYACDPDKLALNPPQFAPRPSSTQYPTPSWNSAAFTDRIAVRISGKYRPITPVLLFLPSEIDFEVIAVVGSEG